MWSHKFNGPALMYEVAVGISNGRLSHRADPGQQTGKLKVLYVWIIVANGFHLQSMVGMHLHKAMHLAISCCS
jgi:hypothetical protein